VVAAVTALVLLAGAVFLTLVALVVQGFNEGSDGSWGEPWQGDLQLVIALAGLGLIIAALAAAGGDRVKAAYVLLGTAVFTYAIWAALLVGWGVFFD
jgi:hypothetical protein